MNLTFSRPSSIQSRTANLKHAGQEAGQTEGKMKLGLRDQ